VVGPAPETQASSEATPPAAPSASSAGPAAASSGWSPTTPEGIRLSAPCILAGAPHTIAPRALLRVGIETASTSDRIALGLGLSDREGFVVALDPSTFVASSSSKAKSDDSLRRVVPVFTPPEDLTGFLETGRRKGLEAAHPVVADPPFLIAVEDGALVWAPSRSVAPTQLWPVLGDAPVDSIRAVELPKHAGYAVAFRQGTSLYLGALHPDKTADGELTRIGGLGPQIGAPAIAAISTHVLVAWADRPAPSAPWAIRWLTWHPGLAPSTPTVFAVPLGGSGGQVMSPALTALDGDRFVMAWTEGGGAKHEVRAVALDATEHLVGTALTVSNVGVNAGQGVPALTPDGRGAIVFLATPNQTTASVVAVPVICPGS